ncbi:MAG: OmpA family protein, partial [Terriglobia bacterium]
DELTQEAIALTESVTAECRVPPVGSRISALPSAIPCVDERYRLRRDVYAARLSGTPAQEANRPLAQHIGLQQDLQTLGFLPPDAAIDGDYGPVTRAAIEAWQQSRGLTVTGFLGGNDGDLLAAQASNSAPAPTKELTSPTVTEPPPTIGPAASPGGHPVGLAEARTSTVDVVPLQEKGGTFVVPVQINGAITLGFVVDSGSTDVQIPLDVFSTLVRAKTIVASDLIGDRTYLLADGSTQKEPRFIVRELKVGSYTFRNVPASVSAPTGSLLLGESFLSRFAQWTLDNQQHVLRLVEKSVEPVSQAPAPDQSTAAAAVQGSTAQCLNGCSLPSVGKLGLYRSEFFGKLREALAEEPGIRVVGDRFVLQNEVLFPIGSADLTAEGKLRIIEVALTLQQIDKKIPASLHWVLEVEGYTDKTPIHTPQYSSNWELSAQRAINVVQLLIQQGIPPDRLVAVGFGDTRPLDPADTPAAYAEDRRIELRLSSH